MVLLYGYTIKKPGTFVPGIVYVREKIRTPDTLVRSQVLYPAELHSHTILYCSQLTYVNQPNAGDRNRTGTGGKSRRILSPVRLPVPPRRHIYKHS